MEGPESLHFTAQIRVPVVLMALVILAVFLAFNAIFW